MLRSGSGGVLTCAKTRAFPPPSSIPRSHFTQLISLPQAASFHKIIYAVACGSLSATALLARTARVARCCQLLHLTMAQGEVTSLMRRRKRCADAGQLRLLPPLLSPGREASLCKPYTTKHPVGRDPARSCSSSFLCSLIMSHVWTGMSGAIMS